MTNADSIADAPPVHAARYPGKRAQHRVVVVGGGTGGLELVTRLGNRLGRRGRASITLLERARTHFWKPMLYDAAAGAIDPGAYEVNYLAQAHWHGFRFRFGEMIGLDRGRQALGGTARAVFGVIVRTLAHRTRPKVKLH